MCIILHRSSHHLFQASPGGRTDGWRVETGGGGADHSSFFSPMEGVREGVGFLALFAYLCTFTGKSEG